MDATFLPFLSSDNPEFQTGFLGPNPQGSLYLHCISPTTLPFYLRLGLHLPCLFERWKECVRPFALFKFLFSVQITRKWMLFENEFPCWLTAELGRDLIVSNMWRLNKRYLFIVSAKKEGLHAHDNHSLNKTIEKVHESIQVFYSSLLYLLQAQTIEDRSRDPTET